jgi:SM-20-related protein
VQESDYFNLLDIFVGFLNRTCYVGMAGDEFHCALYEQGSFYKKHRDQFKNDQGRAF